MDFINLNFALLNIFVHNCQKNEVWRWKLSFIWYKYILISYTLFFQRFYSLIKIFYVNNSTILYNVDYTPVPTTTQKLLQLIKTSIFIKLNTHCISIFLIAILWFNVKIIYAILKYIIKFTNNQACIK